MKKERNTDNTVLRKELVKLKKQNESISSQLNQLKSEKTALKRDLSKERKKDVKIVTLSKEQEQLLLRLLLGIGIQNL